MIALATIDDWSAIEADVTADGETDTWTPGASVRDVCAAAQDLVAWYGSGARPWSDTLSWTPVRNWADLARNSTALWGWYPQFSAPLLEEIAGNSAYDELINNLVSAGTSWPDGDWELRLWDRRGAGAGEAAARGGIRSGVPGLGERAVQLRAVLTLGDTERLQAICAQSASPRSAWVWQHSRAQWRQVAFGPVRLSSSLAGIWQADVEAVGIGGRLTTAGVVG